MARSVRKGFCRICGAHEELTYEHLPPRSAYNDRAVLLHSLQYISDQSYQITGKMPTRRHNRGLGDRSLCGRCNSFTGGNYGDAYLSFAQQAMEYLDVMEKSQSIALPFHIQPLNVLKQIVSMGLTGSSSGGQRHPELARFVLRAKSRTFPTDYSCYVYLANKKSVARYCTETATLNTSKGSMDHILVEVALPPLGCVVVHKNTERASEIIDINLCRIDHFANYDFSVWTTMFLRIPIHRIWSPTPLDYRKID
jgi:hypothetical protein